VVAIEFEKKMENYDLELSLRLRHTSYCSVPFVLEYIILFKIMMLTNSVFHNCYGVAAKVIKTNYNSVLLLIMPTKLDH
jgi:hypothetical protein